MQAERVLRDLQKIEEIKPIVLQLLNEGQKDTQIISTITKQFNLSKISALEIFEEIVGVQEDLVDHEKTMAKDNMLVAGVPNALQRRVDKLDLELRTLRKQ